MSTRAEWIDDLARVREIEPAWQALADRMDSPFAGPEAVLSWWEGFGAGLDPRFCALWEGDELIGLLPLVADPSGRLCSASNDHSSMLVPAARDDRALEALFDAVLADGRDVELVPLLAPPPVREALGRAAGRRRARMVSETWVAAPYIATDGDFEAYRKATHPSWMKRLARYRRQMDRKYELELVVAQPVDDPRAEIAAGMELEASGWKGEEGTAMLHSEAAQRFYLALGERWHERGELRISRIRLDGELVAFDLAVERGGRLFSLKTAYSEEHRQIVPGLVLRLSLIEACFERGLQAHELLGDMFDWKEKFATGRHDLQRVRLYAPTPGSRARWAWQAQVKPALKRLRVRRGPAATT